ncbi:hypothetical protein LPJ61_000835 [Coemansia biformis]|uniref:DUF1014-domain-containing protein n=1 Tax=Coemansia biformis TaxID=1286918 RepID=A0A9W7YGC6_9FUNG|nr:hypothetical protein LPJ61_000835 [Coemansia biformis]
MPKKFQGENTKVKAAKEKKAAAKEDKDAKVRQKKDAEEAHQWEAGAKSNGKKEDQEAKRLEKLARKKEADALLESENKANAKPKDSRAGGTKSSIKPTVTRGAEKKAVAKEVQVAAAAEEQGGLVEAFAASNIDDALALMDAVDEPTDGSSRARKAAVVDRHPERRMKAALAEYTERMLPIIKEEHPGLRQSQMKDIIFKRWQKAPENPFNQAHAAYNARQDDVHGIVQEETQQTMDRLRVD